jgi:SAM-dependent methyltransferase
LALTVEIIASVDTPQTWHHGLVAEWWAQFNTDGPEIEYFRARIADSQPVLDAGCGTGRLLVPWLHAGIDVDGCDVSADMVELCRERARREGFDPMLFVQALHGLNPPRRYHSIVVCGVFGLGSTRAEDQQSLFRLRESLEPGGTLLLDNQVPYSNTNMWPRWTKPGREELPSDWSPLEPEWRAEGGSEYALQARVLSFDPLDQSAQLVLRAQKRVGGEVIAVEEHRLSPLRNYFRDELLLMLERAGFESVRVEAGYTGDKPTADDDFLVFIARR